MGYSIHELKGQAVPPASLPANVAPATFHALKSTSPESETHAESQ